MIARIQVRRDTAANWTANDPILTNGEIGYETNTHKFKIGNNTSTWSQLNYELGQWNSDSSGNITYGAQSGEGNVTVTKNLTVEGDFTVNGTTTTINTEEVTIEDNMVILNSNLTGAPPSSLDAGIEVNLGTSGSQKFYWDQATSKWTLDADVNVLGDIYSNGTALWRLNGNDIYFTGGNVGINTATPSEKLEVLGNIKATNNISSATTKTYQITSNNGTDEYYYIGKLQHNNSSDGYANIVVYNHVDYGLHQNTRLEVQISQRSGTFVGNAILYGDRVTGENVDILCYEDSASQNIFIYAKVDSFGLSIIEVTHMGGSDYQISQNTEGTTVPTSSGARVDGGSEIFNSADNIDFMVSKDGNVGIGTTSPDAPLEVRKNSVSPNLLLRSLSNTDPTLSFLSDSKQFTIGIDDTNNSLVFSEGSALGSSDRMTIDSSGNVGIGTSSPSRQLDIENSSGSSFASIVSNITGDSAILLGDTDADNKGQIYYRNSDDSLAFFTNSSEKIRIKSDGNVGIGTTSPSAKLHIDIPAYDVNVHKQNPVFSLNVGTNNQLINHNSTAIGRNLTVGQIVSGFKDGNDSFAIGRDNSCFGFGSFVGGNISVSGLTGAQGSTNCFAFGYSVASTGSESFAIGNTTTASGYASVSTGRNTTASGDYSNTSGRNTTASGDYSTAMGFDTSVSGNYAIGLGHTIVASGYNSFAQGHATTATGTQSIAMGREMIVSGDNSFGIGLNNPASEHTLAQDNTFSIMGGKVGIGTVAPTAPLHVRSDNDAILILQSNDSTTGSAYLEILDSASASKGFLGYGSTNDDNLSIWNREVSNLKFATSNSEKMRLNSTGSLGIGTTAPAEKLEVNGAIKLGATSTTHAGTIQWTGSDFEGYTGSAWESLTNGSVSSQWTTSGNDIHYTTGNVAIGTSTQSNARFTVDSSTGNLVAKFQSTDSDAYIAFADDSTSTPPLVGAIADDFCVLTANTRRMTILNSNGNVGIGTTNPDGRLHVQSSGTGAENVASFGNGSINSGLYIRTDDGNLQWGLATVNQRDLIFETNQTRRMTIDGVNGKVGIGTSDPDDLIHVSDTSAGSNPGIRIENDDQEWVIYNRGSSSDRFQIFDVDNSKSPFRILPNSPTNAISINATGVGMGKESASEVLDVVGNITATGTITSSSDITLKENIELISDPIEKVKEISGYTFNKKGEDLRLVGLIAQEVEKVLPEAVAENNEGLKSVAYGNLVALLVECVKKQDERIDQLEKTIEKLK